MIVDDKGITSWATRTIEESNLIKVTGLITDGYSQTEIAEELKLSKGYVSKLVKRAKNES